MTYATTANNSQEDYLTASRTNKKGGATNENHSSQPSNDNRQQASRRRLQRSVAMVKAWALVKMEAVETKVAGVAQGNRQTALDRLANYQPEDINIELKREVDNQHDKNAVAVMVSAKGSKYYHMGYLPRHLAAMIAPILDKGKAVQSVFKEIRGGLDKYMNYGLRIELKLSA